MRFEVSKAIVMKAPMPLLVRYGIKTIETKTAPPSGPMRPDGVRGESGHKVERGERIAIVMGKGVFRYDEYPEAWDQLAEVMGWPASYTDRSANGMDLAEAFRRDEVASFPLGAVVCTVTIEDALPIVETGEESAIRTIDRDGDDTLWITEPVRYPLGGIAEVGGEVWTKYVNEFAHGDKGFVERERWEEFCDREGLAYDLDQREVSAEFSLGDFTPGRWGWLLADVRPCDPVPVKGAQGVFRLPADVAEALS